MCKKIGLFILLQCFLFACTTKTERNTKVMNAPDIELANGKIVSKDSIQSPKVINAGRPLFSKVQEPSATAAVSNVYKSLAPSVVKIGKPYYSSPGKDTFLLPEQIKIKEVQEIAKTPESIIVKEPYTRDHNSHNFCSYGKLQGLKHGNVNCMLQDKFGNIWVGTAGGGVTKYDGHTFTHYTETEGLSNNAILSIYEDANDNLWFGTYGGGVSKYDGKNFSKFDNTNGFGDVILSIAGDRKGNIWFSHLDGGVSVWDGKYGNDSSLVFKRYKAKEGFTDRPVRALFVDKDDMLWLGTEGDGVFTFDGKTFTRFTKKQGLPNNMILTILQDMRGDMWFGTDDSGIVKFDGKTFVNYTTKQGLSSDYISSAIEDQDGALWFGTYGGGMSKFELPNKYGMDADFPWGKFTHYTESQGLFSNIIFSVFEDNCGNIWSGPYTGGLSKYNGKSFTHITNKEGLANNAVFAICEDKGTLWFGTNGGGVSKYDGKSFVNFTTHEGLSNSSVWAILKDKYENIWLGTNGGGVCKYSRSKNGHITITVYGIKEGLSNNSVRSILEDKAGNLWFGTEGGGVSKFDGKTFTNYTVKEGLSSNFVFSMVEDNAGNIWFGTYGGGVCKYNGKTFTHYTEKEGLANNSVLSMIKDANGNLWFGTSGGGVDKFDGKHFTHFTEKEGLLNNFVLSILQDKKGNFWFGTRFGISKLTNNYMAHMARVYAYSNKEQGVFFKNYSYQDGFLGVGCNAKAICQDKQGAIWIGANDRLTVFHPEVEDTDTLAPNVQLTNIELFSQNIPWLNFEKHKDTTITLQNGVKIADLYFDNVSKWYNLPQNLNLSHTNNYLGFHFIGITQKQSKKIKYQYKLEGFDDNWSNQTTRTDASYGNIPHGEYVFKVKAMNTDGYWSKEFNYPFVIRPPWYKTWWFRTAAVLFFGLILYLIFLWRTRALREGKRILEKTVIERTAEVIHQKDEAEKQRTLVEKKQKEIVDSITYAKRIQDAILPSESLVKKCLPNSFVVYKPKDIVAGDFYWVENIESTQSVVFAVADCTGHGVPGAMISVICNNALNRALKEFKLTKPNEILNKTRELVIEQFEKSDDDVKDGMDISLCMLNAQTKELQWAGANNPLWIIRKKELIEIKPDKQPIGKHAVSKPFTAHFIPLEIGDCIYVFTDGFADQFGGSKGKKYKIAALRELLVKIAQNPMETQKQEIVSVFETWKGELDQVDDVCMIGVRF